MAAHQQILTEVAALDADASVYDPDNPDTWTLRESGGSEFYTEIADGMENRAALVMATESVQPIQEQLSTGRLVASSPSGGKFMLATFAATISQPNTVLCVHRFADLDASASGYNMWDSADAPPRQLFAQTQADALRLFAGTVVDGGSADTNWRIAQSNHDGADSELFKDGVSSHGGNAGTNGLGGIGILAANAALAGAAKGQIGLLVVFSGLVTNAATANLRSIINAGYPIGEAS